MEGINGGETGFISKMGSSFLLVPVSSAVLSSAVEVRSEAKGLNYFTVHTVFEFGPESRLGQQRFLLAA